MTILVFRLMLLLIYRVYELIIEHILVMFIKCIKTTQRILQIRGF